MDQLLGNGGFSLLHVLVLLDLLGLLACVGKLCLGSTVVALRLMATEYVVEIDHLTLACILSRRSLLLEVLLT